MGRSRLFAVVANTAVLLSGVAFAQQNLPYRPVVALSVGQSLIVHSARGECGELVPDWPDVLPRLPELKTGVFLDGGLGIRESENCNGRTAARGVVYLAETSGFEQIDLFGDSVRIIVGEKVPVEGGQEGIRCVQSQLGQLGFDAGGADGIIGRRTIGAADAYVTARKAESPGWLQTRLSEETAKFWCEALASAHPETAVHLDRLKDDLEVEPEVTFSGPFQTDWMMWRSLKAFMSEKMNGGQSYATGVFCRQDAETGGAPLFQIEYQWFAGVPDFFRWDVMFERSGNLAEQVANWKAGSSRPDLKFDVFRETQFVSPDGETMSCAVVRR